ncbi:MAG: DNA polymerase III subunit gamma/tau [Patescibacteria group bacterium]
MGKAFYRKYRPKKLSEVVGQEHVTNTLSRAFKKSMISHAYLLTGPKGVGKTSIARIIAYEVNSLPYDEEATHLDIIEIDAASNRRIDEIRELKERVNIAPTSAKYKVYIIDEVHMLTKEAFNALLKTLEEPPEHAIFILATTEAHKVPETIISRTQRFSFKPVSMAKVTAHLRQIAKLENIVIEDAALELIAAHGEGSFRDSISLLDQVRHMSENVTLENVQRTLGQAPEEILENILGAIEKHDFKAIASSLSDLRNHGVQAALVAHQLSQLLRFYIVNNNASLDAPVTLDLLKDLLQVPASSDAEVALELALYRSALDAPTSESRNTSKHSTPTPTLVSNHQKPVMRPKTLDAPEIPITSDTTKPHSSESVKTTQPRKGDAFDGETWQDILAAIKAKHNTLYSVVRMAQPEFEPKIITLTFAFAFHQKRLDDTKNKQILLGIIKEVTGRDVTLVCILEKKSDTSMAISKPEPQPDTKNNLEAISNIFGSAEIVE